MAIGKTIEEAKQQLEAAATKGFDGAGRENDAASVIKGTPVKDKLATMNPKEKAFVAPVVGSESESASAVVAALPEAAKTEAQQAKQAVIAQQHGAGSNSLSGKEIQARLATSENQSQGQGVFNRLSSWFR